MTKKFSSKFAHSFLFFATGALLVGSLYTGCGDDSSSKPQESPAEESEQKDDDSIKDSVENSNQKDSSGIADTLQQVEMFEKSQFVAIKEYSFKEKITEASILEIGQDKALTGREFMVKADCDTCAFVFKNLKLQSPLAFVKIENRTSTISPEISFVDLSRTDTIYPNLLTAFECKRILKLIKDGLPSDSAERVAQREVLKDLLGEAPNIKLSNQIPKNEKDTLSQNIKKALNSGNMYYIHGIESFFEETGKWEKDSLKIKYADYLTRNYMYLYYEEEAKPERKIATGIYGRIYGLGECNSKNIDSVKVVKDSLSENFMVAFTCSEEYGWYVPDQNASDTYGWEPGHDGEMKVGGRYDRTYTYDSVQGKWVSASIEENVPCITTNLGKVIKLTRNTPDISISGAYRICKESDTQIYWHTATEIEYYAQKLDCDSTGKIQTSLVDSTIKLICSEGKFRIPLESELSNDLLEREAKLGPCGEEESFRQGLIDTTIYYHCYRGELNFANSFDMEMGHSCNAEHEGYYQYYNSMFSCNGVIWKYATDSLLTDSITDERDGSVYKTVGIGKQVWIAQNLNYAIDSSWCPKDSLEYCEKYGRFYRWDAILGASPQETHICPEGFHVPSNSEWEELINFTKPWFKNKVARDIFVSKNALEHSDGVERGEDYVGLSIYMIGSRSLKGAYSGWLFGAHLCSQDYTDSTSYIYKISRDTHDFLPYTQKQFLSCNVRCLKD